MRHMRTMEMQSAPGRSGYSGNRRSPIGIGGAVAVHAAVIGAFLLMPRDMIERLTPPPFIIHAIPLDPTPPDSRPPRPDKPTAQTPAPRPTTTHPLTPPATDQQVTDTGTGRSDTSAGSGSGIVIPPLDPPRQPVLVEAAIDPRALPGFQPDYPGTMIRQQIEGSVTVRVTIGSDGRVLDIERLSATDEAFWLATQRQALRKWRFRPATRDGVPVGTIKTLTVHFRLEDR